MAICDRCREFLRMEGFVLLIGAAIGFIGLLGGVLLAVAAMTGGAGQEERRRR